MTSEHSIKIAGVCCPNQSINLSPNKRSGDITGLQHTTENQNPRLSHLYDASRVLKIQAAMQVSAPKTYSTKYYQSGMTRIKPLSKFCQRCLSRQS